MKSHIQSPNRLLATLICFLVIAGAFVLFMRLDRSAMAARGAEIKGQSEATGAPWVRLRTAGQIPTGASAMAKAESDQPLALAAADFDEDGVPDLVTSYASSQLSVMRGNVDAIYPNSPEARERRQRGDFTGAPFLLELNRTSLPEPADLIGTGDFDADGHWDIVATRQGGDKLYWLRGDGHGGFAAAKIIHLPGTVTSMATGEMNRADGLTDIALGVVTSDGPRVLVFESPNGALQGAPESFELPAAASALALGQLDDDSAADLAIATGNDVMVVHGRDRKLSLDTERQAEVQAAQVSRTVFESAVLAIAVGDFTGDAKQELAVLTADGNVRVLERGGASGNEFQANKAMTLNVATSGLDGASPRRLLATKVSSLPKDDLLVFGGTKGMDVVTTSTAPTLGQPTNLTSAGSDGMSLAASVSSDREVTAVLPMRLNASALKDLVVLERNGSAPSLVATQTAATFVVNISGSTNDKNPGDGICEDTDGNCSYDAALQESNAHPGADTITFNIPGGGVPKIFTGNIQITDAVTIDGTTQPGGRVEIAASSSSSSGYPIQLLADNCVVRGLATYPVFTNTYVFLVGSSGNIIEGNYIGLKGDGTKGLDNPVNVTGIGFANSPANNLIGGTTAAARNIISGCDTGIYFNVAGPGNIIRGNYFGTNPSGTAGIANNVYAILLSATTDYTVGGTTAGAGNLISGASYPAALYVGSTGALIQGNRFGTTADGTQPIAIAGDAIAVVTAAPASLTIGGTTPAARNVISASANGIRFASADGTNSLIQGNFIGTNAAGTAPLSNFINGVWLQGVQSITIGGTAPGAGNVISSSGLGGKNECVHDSSCGYGIEISGGRGAVIQGNLIGTDVNGVVAIPNLQGGIYLVNGFGTLIGGPTAEARNVISGNSNHGISLFGGDGREPTRIEGNYIGLNRFGTGALGNAKHGILYIGGTGCNVGGLAPGAGNRIAFNGGAGIASTGGGAIGGAVLSNSIFSNAGLGIDQGEDGVNPPSNGGDVGRPVLTSVTTSGSETTITGNLRTGNIGTGQTPFTIQFFSNIIPDPSGYGEGQVLIGQTTATVGSFATVSFTATITPAVPPGRFISAVAVGSPDINFPILGLFSSEFSFCTRVAGVATPENTPLRLNLVTPMTGGDNGGSTLTIIGEGISQNATVRLRRVGQNDIAGASIIVAADGSSLIARFNLSGQARGAWDVVVTNADGTIAILPGAFTIEAAREVAIWTDLLGRTGIRRNVAARYTVLCGNRGNTDAYAVPLFITGIPTGAKVTLGFELTPVLPLTGPGLPNFNPSDIPAVIQRTSDQIVPLIIPVIPVGTVRSLSFTIEVPADQSDFALRVFATSPLLEVVDSSSSAQYSSRQVIEINAPGGPIKLALSQNGQDCLQSILTNSVSCGLNFLGKGCVALAVSAANLAGSMYLLIKSPPANSAQAVVSFSQLLAGTISTSLAINSATCLGNSTPFPKILNTISCALNVFDAGGTCAPAVRDFLVRIVLSFDPNDKVGSQGSGIPQYVAGADPFRYAIYFENKEAATAPAQSVVITDQLDLAKFDLSTFQLGAISFGKSVVVTPPPGLTEWTTDVDLRPANNLVVRIIAGLDNTTGVVTWRFVSLDTATMQPTDDPLAGFLPPNRTAPEGDGVVVFTVKPKPGQPTETQTSNKARIIFDANAPIDTPEWLNTIDNSLPASHVTPLPATQSSVVFDVQWSGTDTGSGIGNYTIFVSENGGPFTIWLNRTTAASGTFVGQPGKTYAFYSIAQDQTGNQENAKAVAEASTSTPTPSGPTVFLEEGTSNSALALDSVTFVRGPFSLTDLHNFSSDQRTRVILFTTSLGSNPVPSAITVTVNGISLTVENAGTVSGVVGLDGSYIVVVLPSSGLPAGDWPLTLTFNGVASSNSPTLSISP